MNFQDYFLQSTGKPHPPYDYQCRLASLPCESRLIQIPTGMGKTAAVLHAWMWNRVFLKKDAWPRRLVYCLPMRTLVEQTYAAAKQWLENLLPLHGKTIGLHMLMGGEASNAWELYPEEDAILIGTQDMLLSRALNRGYGVSRFRWPMHYGLLHTDALWVFDEVQLMGAGLPTTAQLAAFRESYGTSKPCYSWWMSATSDPSWLRTVNHNPENLGAALELAEADTSTESVQRLRNAKKLLHSSLLDGRDPKKLAAEIQHMVSDRKGLTLIVINTVKQAKALHHELSKLHKGPADSAPVLLHSQFRPEERAAQLREITAAEGQDRIVVSTQIIEAGIDLSAATLFTEMAPWSSLVQRFGRCNRRGTEEDAQIFLILPAKSLPYTEEQTAEATKRTEAILATDDHSVSPARLSAIAIPLCDQPVSQHIIRQRDFLDLFDTTPDLSGQDIDIDRWVRDIEDSKVQLFWRDWTNSDKGEAPPSTDFPNASRRELCPAPVGEAKAFCDKLDKTWAPWRWDHLRDCWQKATKEMGKYQLLPGQIYLFPSKAGGYSPKVGFDPSDKSPVTPVSHSNRVTDGTSADPTSQSAWQSIALHTDEVCGQLATIMAAVPQACPALPIAARWHDLGKAHAAFQAKIRPEARLSEDGQQHSPIAKAPNAAWKHPAAAAADAAGLRTRPKFRHELASALAVLQPGCGGIPEELRNLVAWLVATHHGKIRLSIRALPEEDQPADGGRFARGVWDGDVLPAVNLGGGVTSPEVTLSLEPMEMGLGVEPPFLHLPSWAERMLALRDDAQVGPLRLAYWETLLRAADQRASALATTEAVTAAAFPVK